MLDEALAGGLMFLEFLVLSRTERGWGPWPGFLLVPFR